MLKRLTRDFDGVLDVVVGKAVIRWACEQSSLLLHLAMRAWMNSYHEQKLRTISIKKCNIN